MKAIVRTKFGSPDVLQLKEVEKPTPTDSQVLARVHAASVNASDWHLLRGKPVLGRLIFRSIGLLKPKSARYQEQELEEERKRGKLYAHPTQSYIC